MSEAEPGILDDLAAFAAIEVQSHDLEPWAELIGALLRDGTLDREETHWLVKGYNAYDALSSAWKLVSRWSGPMEWLEAPDRDDARQWPCTNERRNLRAGKVLIHLESYAAHLGGLTQDAWVSGGLAPEAPDPWGALTGYLRSVWGVGRQTAFEWAEFLAKCLGVPVVAADAQLWESEGPRRALQRIYGNPKPSQSWLDERALECKEGLAERGVDLPWEDFETVICDFNVMRDGRYYPGRHLAALREEIDEVPAEDREPLERAWRSFVPEGWADIAPGIDKSLLPVYRNTGKITVPEVVR